MKNLVKLNKTLNAVQARIAQLGCVRVDKLRKKEKQELRNLYTTWDDLVRELRNHPRAYEEGQICFGCGTYPIINGGAKSKCDGCGLHYCGRDCQKKDWKAHETIRSNKKTHIKSVQK